MPGDFAFADGTVPSAANWNTNVRDQLVIICTSTTRPSAPATGRRIYETDTGLEYVYGATGWTLYNTAALCSAWTAYTPVWGCASNAPVLAGGTILGRYRQIGKTVDIVIAFVASAVTTFGSGGWTFTMPTGMTAAFAYPTGRGTCVPDTTRPVVVHASGNFLYLNSHTSSTDSRITGITATTPATWGTADTLYAQVTVEIT